MSPKQDGNRAADQAKVTESEQNILVQIMYDRVPAPIRTLNPGRTRNPVGLRGGRRRSHSLVARMAARTVPDPITGCWNFTGCKVGPNGYGQICRENGERAYAHRVAWELAHPNDKVPADLRILHSCDNPRCVNPEHLRLGTQAENIHESIQKGRYRTFGIQKLNAEQVQEIRRLGRLGLRHRDIGDRFGIARNTVSQILGGKTWAHLPEELPKPILERVPSVQVPVRGVLHLEAGQ